MGGFEGGDEAGFWDEIPQGRSERYHETLPKLSISVDETTLLCFNAAPTESFSVVCCDQAVPPNNLLFLAYTTLYKQTQDDDLLDFFCEHQVAITTDKQSFEALDDQAVVASFVDLTNDVCQLLLDEHEKSEIIEEVLNHH